MGYFLSFTIVVAAALWIGIMILIFSAKLFSTMWPLTRNSRKQLERGGVEAEAVILKMERTGLVIDNLAQVKLQMRVQPDKGRNFIAEVEKMIEGNEQPAFRTGTIVKVKFNPNNYRQLILI